MEVLAAWFKTTPVLSCFVDEEKIKEAKLLEEGERLVLCCPNKSGEGCKGGINCSCFLKHYFEYRKDGDDWQAKVYMFSIKLVQPHKTFPLQCLPINIFNRHCYAVHNFPQRIRKEDFNELSI